MAIPLYNAKFTLLISASFITIFSSIAIYFCLPILISHVIRTQLTLSPTSGSYNDWRFNSVVDRIYLYNITNLDDVLNGNNDGAVTTTTSSTTNRNSAKNNNRNGRPLLKLKEVGPFTFRQDREKINIKFDLSNETVIYDQVKRWTFLPELSSVKTMKDFNSTWINHVSIPLAGTTLNQEFASFVDPIVAEFDLKLFQKHTADILLFDGYFDILMEQGKYQGKVDIDKFGWMYNQNNSVARNIRIFTGPSNTTLDKLGTLDQFNFKKRMTTWRNNNNSVSDPKGTSNIVQCNEFRYASAGEFFPPPEGSIISHNNNPRYQQNQPDLNEQQENINTESYSPSSTSTVTPASQSSTADRLESINLLGHSILQQSQYPTVGKTISIYMSDLCRTFRLVYNSTYDYKGLKVDRYIANEFTYDYTEPDQVSAGSSRARYYGVRGKNPNMCYCIYDEHTKLTKCPPNGMMDLYTCREGSPLTLSFPHFLYSNQDQSLSPYLGLFEDDIEPNESDHQFFIDLESTLNIPVKAQVVIQFNVHYRNENSLGFTSEYSFLTGNPEVPINSSMRNINDFYLPQMWIKSSAEIDEQNLSKLKFIQHQLKLVTPITTIISFGIASILLMMSAKLAYDLTYGPKSRKSISADQESCSSLNRTSGSFIENKQKYYAMQLLSNEKSQSADKSNGSNHDDRMNKPTTSSRVDDFGTCESQPLNREREK